MSTENLSANWSYPTAIRFGAGRVRELADLCQQLGIRRPLFVTDKILAKLPISENTQKILRDAGIEFNLFSEVDANPTDNNLAAGLAAYRQGKHDGVIAFGGGSAIDLGKVIAFMSGQKRPVWDFEDIGDWWTRADVTGIAPIIAIPTTAGTGTEVGRAGVIVNSETHVKKIIFHPKILPSAVICDAELTCGMPKVITVGTGIDAFVHCLEAYSSNFYHPMSQGIALEGMRLVKENLPLAVAEPQNLLARANMMSAAAMGAVAFQKGLGGIHALAHPIGAVFNTHHGMTNAVLIPPVLQFNKPMIVKKIDAAAAYLGISGGFDGFADYVLHLRSSLGVPDKLEGLGVNMSSAQVSEIAKMAQEDPSSGGNPRTLTVADLQLLLEASL